VRDEIIAMLPPEQRRRGGLKAPRVLVRRPDGRIEVDALSDHARDWAAVAAATRCRGISPKLDPDTRDGIGREMDLISSRTTV
jgi:hypothetical protein